MTTEPAANSNRSRGTPMTVPVTAISAPVFFPVTSLRNGPEKWPVGGQRRSGSQTQDLRRPVLRSAHRGAAEENADVRRAGDFLEFRGRIVSQCNQIGGISTHRLQFARANHHQRIGRKFRRITEKQLFRSHSVRCPHRSRRDRDQARDSNTRRNTFSNRAAHGMPGKNRALGIDHSARK